MKLETLAQVNVERAARRPVIVVTDTGNGEQRLVKAADIAADPLGEPTWRNSCEWARAA